MMPSAGIDPSTLLAATPHGTASDLKGRTPIEVAREFESMLVTQMISAMRKTVGESGLLPESPQRKVLDGVFDNEMASSLVAAGGLGLAETLAAQIQDQAARSAAAGGRPALPVAGGTVSSGYGMRVDPISGRSQLHAGIDVAAPAGSEIHSVRDGVVVFSGERGAAGQVVEVRNRDGSVATYAHVAARLAEEGQPVAAGDVVATVGSTGRSTGPHLHFAVRRDGRTVDPTPWLTPTASAERSRGFEEG